MFYAKGRTGRIVRKSSPILQRQHPRYERILTEFRRLDLDGLARNIMLALDLSGESIMGGDSRETGNEDVLRLAGEDRRRAPQRWLRLTQSNPSSTAANAPFE